MHTELILPFERTPLAEIVEQIQHGPYEAAPDALVFHYLLTRHHRPLSVHSAVTTEQYIQDIQHQWQYDQHHKAVHKALKKHRISPEHSSIMINQVLWPWSSMVSWEE